MDMYGIFTYMKTIKNNTFMLGKYTVRPMDTMGYAYLDLAAECRMLQSWQMKLLDEDPPSLKM